jgi:riboflavin kinase/FMN adenylyltransferase
LVEKLNVKKVFIGYDHRFGRNRSADIDDLKSFGEIYDFEVIEISAQEIAEVAVSSTKIRKALDKGAVEQANAYLGNPFGLTGKVQKGKSLGRTLGFPTANIVVEEDYKLIPANGAYWVYAIIENKKVYGMMNIGFNPTVAGNERSIEVHFFDWTEELYGKLITIRVLRRIRNEQKFDSVAALSDQLKKDQSLCEKWMASI